MYALEEVPPFLFPPPHVHAVEKQREQALAPLCRQDARLTAIRVRLQLPDCVWITGCHRATIQTFLHQSS